jgi:FkbM family methyltransferase
MARRVGETGRVYSFEPTPLTREVLRQTVALNNCEKIVEVCEEAVKDKTGTFSFYDTGDPISNANSLICTERSKHEVMVKTVSLDDFTERRGVSISCLKIDAEGAELDILRGARNTFLTSRPAVQIEVHPHAIAQAGGTLREVWDLLRSYRMSVFYADSPVTDEWFCGLADGVELQVLPEEYSVSQGR